MTPKDKCIYCEGELEDFPQREIFKCKSCHAKITYHFLLLKWGIIGRRKTFLNWLNMKREELEIKYKEFMGYCEECQIITRHNNEGNCVSCEAYFYANHYQPE